MKGDGFLDVQVDPAYPFRGPGLVTNTRLLMDDFVCEYTGPIISRDLADVYKGMGRYSHFISLDSGHVIVGFSSSDLPSGAGQASLCNDPRGSKQLPNVRAVKIESDSPTGKKLRPWTPQIGAKSLTRIVFVATRNIRAGEPLLYSYGTGYWKNPPMPMRSVRTRSMDGSVPRIPSYTEHMDKTWKRRDFKIDLHLRKVVRENKTLKIGIHRLLTGIGILTITVCGPIGISRRVLNLCGLSTPSGSMETASLWNQATMVIYSVSEGVVISQGIPCALECYRARDHYRRQAALLISVVR